MTIRIERRGESPRCAYCLDDVVQGVVCDQCSARYHDECAAVFGRCGILGCTQRFAADAAAVVLPRLGALARRLGQWHHEALLAGDAHALVLEPCPWSVTSDPAAARAVADLLGGDFMPYDGRVRLQSRFPEPLVRFASLPAAQEACQRLGAVKVPATTVPLRDLLRPLDPFVVTTLHLGADGVEVEERDGARRRWAPGRERLVVVGREVVLRKVTRTSRLQISSGGPSQASRPSFASDTQRSQEEVAFVWGRDDETPAVVRRRKLRIVGGQGSGLTWLQVKAELARGAAVREVDGANAAPLLSLVSLGQGPTSEVRSNAASLALIARMLRQDWLRTLPPPPEGAAKKAGADEDEAGPSEPARPKVVVRPRPRARGRGA